MSQWTHVYGSITLAASVLAERKNSKSKEMEYYLPVPAEQLKLLPPRINCHNELEYDVQTFSLPACKPVITELLKNFPCGSAKESIRYSLVQFKDIAAHTISGWMDDTIAAEAKARLGLIYEDTQNRLDNIVLGTDYTTTDFILTIQDHLRYCSGETLLKAFEKFIIELAAHGVSVDNGYIEWKDTFNYDVLFAIRSEIGNITFNILDRKTNAIKASKVYTVNYNSRTKFGGHRLKCKADSNWKALKLD